MSTAVQAASTVLHMTDLLELIAGFCGPSSHFVMLRVNRTAFEVVLKHIWATLPTAFYILRLLPFFVFRHGLWTLSRATYPAAWEWSRFDVYALHIRRIISLTSSTVLGEHDINPRIYRDLSSIGFDKFRKRPIFPQLRAFSFHGAGLFGNIGPSSIDQLCTSLLEDVEIKAHYDYLTTYLNNLQGSSRVLREMTIAGRFNAEALAKINNFKNLRKLSLELIHTNDADKALVAYPLTDFLQGLNTHLSIEHLVLRASVHNLIRHPYLSSVRHLEIQGTSTTVQNILGAGMFITVVLVFTQVELVTTMNACFATLCRSSSSTIESIIVRSLAQARQDFPIINCINPLLDAPGLRGLSVYHSDRLNIIVNDEAIVQMISAWPRLTKLVMLSSASTPAGRDRRQQPTLNGVYALLSMRSFSMLSLRVENSPIRVQLPLDPEAVGRYPRAPRQLLQWRSGDSLV